MRPEMHEVLAIAVRSRDWGGQDSGGAEADVERRPEHVRDRLGPKAGIAHDALANPAATDLELRLDEQHEVGIVRRGTRAGRAAPS